MRFLEWKCLNFKYNFIDVCSQGSNWKHSSIGSDNGLAPNRRQAIIWTNAVLGYRHKYASLGLNELTYWSRVMYICISKLGHHWFRSLLWHQAIIWTYADLMLIEPSRTNFSEIWLKIWGLTFKKIYLKMSSTKWRPLCLCLNVLLGNTEVKWHQWHFHQC